MNSEYWALVNLPHSTHQKADWALASILTLSPIWAVTVSDVNGYLGLIGGAIGIAIGLIRLYRIIRYKD
jgi:hypothetical protein